MERVVEGDEALLALEPYVEALATPGVRLELGTTLHWVHTETENRLEVLQKVSVFLQGVKPGNKRSTWQQVSLPIVGFEGETRADLLRKLATMIEEHDDGRQGSASAEDTG